MLHLKHINQCIDLQYDSKIGCRQINLLCRLCTFALISWAFFIIKWEFVTNRFSCARQTNRTDKHVTFQNNRPILFENVNTMKRKCLNGYEKLSFSKPRIFMSLKKKNRKENEERNIIKLKLIIFKNNGHIFFSLFLSS